jgi:hypothetical protein
VGPRTSLDIEEKKTLLPFLGIEPQFYACSEQHKKKGNNGKYQLSWKYIAK